MGTDPGRDRGSYGAAHSDVSSQVDIRPLRVHNTLGTRYGNHRAVLQTKVASGRPRQGTSDLNQSGGLAAVPINDHATTQQSLSNNGTSTQDRGGNTNVAAQNATKARVVRVRKVRRQTVIHWVDMVNTPAIVSSICYTEDTLGRRGRPQEVVISKSAPDINKRGGKCNIEHKISKAAPWGPGREPFTALATSACPSTTNQVLV